jgi:hypothetical protein
MSWFLAREIGVSYKLVPANITTKLVLNKGVHASFQLMLVNQGVGASFKLLHVNQGVGASFKLVLPINVIF